MYVICLFIVLIIIFYVNVLYFLIFIFVDFSMCTQLRFCVRVAVRLVWEGIILRTPSYSVFIQNQWTLYLYVNICDWLFHKFRKSVKLLPCKIYPKACMYYKPIHVQNIRYFIGQSWVPKGIVIYQKGTI